MISADYIRHAEEILSTSYIQSEKFSSVSTDIKKYTKEVYENASFFLKIFEKYKY